MGAPVVAWDKHIKLWQLVGAVLAVPAGIAGTYGAYKTYMSGNVSCPELRASIISTLERNIPQEAKRALLREGIADFDKHCAEKDPDARVIFDAAMSAPTSAPNPAIHAAATGAIFGLSRTGERRGWVALIWLDTNHDEKPNFDAGGIPVLAKSPPPVGSILSARRMVAVWLEPHPGNDPDMLQGRLAEGTCVKILSIQAKTPRLWAEVAPQACQ